MVANITRQEETLYEALKPVVSSLGVKLIDVDVRDHQGELLVKVVIDDEDGIGIDDCSRISEQVAPVLEVEDPDLFRESQIEVTSPGVERRLRRTDEFNHYRDREVTVKCYGTYRERKEWEGRIDSSSEDELTLNTEQHGLVSIPLDQIASVRLTFDADDFLSSGGNETDG